MPRRVTGKKTTELTPDELREWLAPYPSCLIDVGTGDGLFPYQWAKDHPETACIGIDLVPENLERMSARAARKPSKGGMPNAIFAIAGAEDLPGIFVGIADLVTVNYPWGLLMRAMVEPEPAVLAGIAATARPGAEFCTLLNFSVFKDESYVERLGAAPLTHERAIAELVPAYAAAGITIREVDMLPDDPPYRTTWGQRLYKGSRRETLRMRGYIGDGGSSDSPNPASPSPAS